MLCSVFTRMPNGTTGEWTETVAGSKFVLEGLLLPGVGLIGVVGENKLLYH